MRISRIVVASTALFVVAAIGAFSGASAWACGPSGGSAASHGNRGGGGGTPKTAQAITYTCPMHPEVSSDKPGKCPKCGMFLDARAAEQTVYTCPMHPEVNAEQPGKCPKCGMNLEKKAEKMAFQYVCPMHTDVVLNKPGNCPKCGMFLEARPKPAVAPAADSQAGQAR